MTNWCRVATIPGHRMISSGEKQWRASSMKIRFRRKFRWWLMRLQTFRRWMHTQVQQFCNLEKWFLAINQPDPLTLMKLHSFETLCLKGYKYVVDLMRSKTTYRSCVSKSQGSILYRFHKMRLYKTIIRSVHDTWYDLIMFMEHIY